MVQDTTCPLSSVVPQELYNLDKHLNTFPQSYCEWGLVHQFHPLHASLVSTAGHARHLEGGHAPACGQAHNFFTGHSKPVSVMSRDALCWC